MSNKMYNDDPEYEKLIFKNYIWTDQCILGFFKENFWLSNFYEHNKNANNRDSTTYGFLNPKFPKSSRAVWHGYPSVENYYQSEKAIDKEGFEQGNLKGPEAYYNFKAEMGKCSPDRAKKLGRAVKLRDDWEQEKVKVMYHALREKFNWYLHPILCKKLLNTRDAYLAELNYWEDYFWGCELVDPYAKNDKFPDYPLIEVALVKPVKSYIDWQTWSIVTQQSKAAEYSDKIILKLYGHNILGKLLMKRREELKIEMPEEYVQELSINGLYGIRGFKILKDMKELKS